MLCLCGQIGLVNYPAIVQLEWGDNPWVKHAEHLGHTMHQLETMSRDSTRLIFIDRNVNSPLRLQI